MQKYNRKFAITLTLGVVFLFVFFFIINNKKVYNPNNPIDTTNQVQTYDDTLKTQYIKSQDAWPPKVLMTDAALKCDVGDKVVSGDGQSTKRVIDGKDYCITATSEGAAGSTFTTYIYKTTKDDKLATISFVLRYPQCDNYDDPKKSECKDERTSFDVDKLANAVIMK